MFDFRRVTMPRRCIVWNSADAGRRKPMPSNSQAPGQQKPICVGRVFTKRATEFVFAELSDLFGGRHYH